VVELDAGRRVARLSDGSEQPFSRCLLCTGGVARTLPGLAGNVAAVRTLRTLDDARALRSAITKQASVVILGAGFVGLEVASTARSLGCAVTVLESAPRVLSRAMPAELSSWLERRVAEAGVDLRLNAQCRSITAAGQDVLIELADGTGLRAPLLVVAIGLQPCVDLARASGLDLHPLNGGIRVDAQGRTSAPAIFAAGDCVSQFQPILGEEMRLESWQSANEQARVAAAAMLGVQTEARAVPWFWTDMFGCNVQMMGLPSARLDYHWRGSADTGQAPPKFLLFGMDPAQRLRHVIAVNAGAELRPLRPLVEQGIPLDPQRLCDTTVALRQYARDATASASSPSPT